jgi:hypothetical protein
MPRMTSLRLAATVSPLVLCAGFASMWSGCANGDDKGVVVVYLGNDGGQHKNDAKAAHHPDAGDADVATDAPTRDAVPDVIDASTDQNAEPNHDAGPDGDASPPNGDASDAVADTGHDAGYDVGIVYWGPPGSACDPLGRIQGEECGRCGNQTSACIERPDGGVPWDAGADVQSPSDAGDAMPPYVWSLWGACTGELTPDAGCMPGTQSIVSCGICGTRLLACEPDCMYGSTPCAGEVDGGCVPGTIDFVVVPSCSDAGVAEAGGSDAAARDAQTEDAQTEDAQATDGASQDGTLEGGGIPDATVHDGAAGEGGVPDAASTDDASEDGGAPDGASNDGAGPSDAGVDVLTVVGRISMCGQACAWDASSTCGPPPTTLTVSSVATGKVGTIVNFVPSRTDDTLEAQTCPTQYLTPRQRSSYGYITLVNPSTTQSALVSVWTWEYGGTLIETQLTSYPTTPTTPTERLNCKGTVNDSCSGTADPTSCHSFYGGLMVGDSNAVRIPAGGSIVIFVQAVNADEYGPVHVTARTESFQ